MYEERKAYRDQAPIMQLDAGSFYRGEVIYYVDNSAAGQENGETVAIVNAYKAAMSSDALATGIKEVLGGEAETTHYSELIDFEAVSEELQLQAQENGVFSVVVYAKDQESCAAVTELVKEAVATEKSKIKSALGNHNLVIAKESVSQVADETLRIYQNSVSEEMKSQISSMADIKKSFTDSQKQYVDLVWEGVNQEQEEKAEEEAPAANVSVSKKMLVLGFLAGAFLAIVFWAAVYMMSGVVRPEDDFEKLLGCKLLGNVPVSENKKRKVFGFVDCLVIKLRHFNRRFFEREKAYDMIAANVRIAMRSIGAKQVILTGAVCGDSQTAVLEALTKRLEKDKIEIVLVSPILYDAEALEKMVEIGNVVLVEKAELSLYDEVAKEIEVCMQQGVNLLGGVVAY